MKLERSVVNTRAHFGVQIKIGTGFLVLVGGDVCLVTAYHNVHFSGNLAQALAIGFLDAGRRKVNKIQPLSLDNVVLAESSRDLFVIRTLLAKASCTPLILGTTDATELKSTEWSSIAFPRKLSRDGSERVNLDGTLGSQHTTIKGREHAEVYCRQFSGAKPVPPSGSSGAPVYLTRDKIVFGMMRTIRSANAYISSRIPDAAVSSPQIDALMQRCESNAELNEVLAELGLDRRLEGLLADPEFETRENLDNMRLILAQLHPGQGFDDLTQTHEGRIEVIRQSFRRQLVLAKHEHVEGEPIHALGGTVFVTPASTIRAALANAGPLEPPPSPTKRRLVLALAIVAMVLVGFVATYLIRQSAKITHPVIEACEIRIIGTTEQISNAYISLDSGESWQVDVAEHTVRFECPEQKTPYTLILEVENRYLSIHFDDTSQAPREVSREELAEGAPPDFDPAEAEDRRSGAPRTDEVLASTSGRLGTGTSTDGGLDEGSSEMGGASEMDGDIETDGDTETSGDAETGEDPGEGPVPDAKCGVRSYECTAEGKCKQRRSWCTAASDADCRGTTYACPYDGRCSLHRSKCVASRTEDCEASITACGSEGRCVAVGGKCVATSNHDCQASWGCKQYGFCSAIGGECVAGLDSECRASEQCRQSGQCRANAHVCVAGSDDDCEKSTNCSKYGMCATKGGECVASSTEDCSKSTSACKEDGRCTRKGNKCVASVDADCEQSKVCKQRGQCTAKGGICVATSSQICRNSQSCLAYGLCGFKDNACVAVSADDCLKSSIACIDYGRCGYQADQCVAISDKQCEDSTSACGESGQCTLVGNRCVATTDDDCAKSGYCIRQGHCTLVDGRCTPASNDDCQRSEHCAEFGSCTLVHNQCRVISDEDCKQAKICTEKGKCTARRGSCK